MTVVLPALSAAAPVEVRLVLFAVHVAILDPVSAVVVKPAMFSVTLPLLPAAFSVTAGLATQSRDGSLKVST